MKLILKISSFIGLALTIVPSLLVLHNIVSVKTNANCMIIGMLIWFSTAPFWMKDTSSEDENI